jgi:hypothetical protein
MKKILMLAFLVLSLTASAKPIQVALYCKVITDDTSAMVMVDGANYEGHVAFNSAMGFMACPFDLNERIRDLKPFKCAGLWDDDEPSGTDTTVEVNFTNGDEGWKANFETNNREGNKAVSLQCI